MAKLKPARAKGKSASPRSGVPCLVLLVSGMILSLVFMYLFLKHASG